MKSRIICLAALIALGGCATVIRGADTTFRVTSEPPQAQVALSTGETCPATPCQFKRPRKEAFTATVSLPGYQAHQTQVTTYWSKKGTVTGIVGNAILGGGIGIGVDAATGANRDLQPNPLHVVLIPEAAPVTSSPPAVEPAPVAEPSEAAPTPPPLPSNESAPR